MNDKNTYKKIKWYKRLFYIVPAFIIFISSCCFLIPKVNGISASANAWIGNLGDQGFAVVDLFAPDFISIKYDTVGAQTELLLTDFSNLGGSSNVASSPSDNSSLYLYNAPFTINNRTIQRYFRVNPTTYSSHCLVNTSNAAVTGVQPYWGEWQTRYTTTLRNPASSGKLSIVFHWDLLVGFVAYDNVIPIPKVSLAKTLSSAVMGDCYSISTSSMAPASMVGVSFEGELYNEYGKVMDLGLVTPEVSSNYGVGSTLSLLPRFYDSSIAGDVRIYKDLTVTLELSLQTTGCFLVLDSCYTLPEFSFSSSAYGYLEKFELFSLDGFISSNINRDYVDWLVLSIGSFFEMELLPGFTVGGVFFTVMAIFLALYFLKLFAGG